MRIVGGEWKGQSLFAPKGANTRPTADAQRESIFNVLLNGLGYQPKRILDLFAGTGALSFEALSHGATSAVLIEADKAAINCIERNAQKLSLAGSFAVITSSDLRQWPKLLKSQAPGLYPFDLIFCDPPYGKGLVEKALASLEPSASEFFESESGCVLVCESSTHDAAPQLPESWRFLKDKSRGTTRLGFYERIT